MEMNLSFHIFNQFLILFLAQISNLKQTMEKWMIVYLLPLEVWVEIFSYPWISRLEFGYFVARIGNFKFAEHAQFYLHEWGKHKLGSISFHKVKTILTKSLNFTTFKGRIMHWEDWRRGATYLCGLSANTIACQHRIFPLHRNQVRSLFSQAKFYKFI